MALFSRVSDCFPGQHGVPRGTAQSVARHSRRDLVGATTRDLLGGGVLATESFYELEDWRRSKPQQRVDIHNHLQRFFSKNLTLERTLKGSRHGVVPSRRYDRFIFLPVRRRRVVDLSPGVLRPGGERGGAERFFHDWNAQECKVREW